MDKFLCLRWELMKKKEEMQDKKYAFEIHPEVSDKDKLSMEKKC